MATGYPLRGSKSNLRNVCRFGNASDVRGRAKRRVENGTHNKAEKEREGKGRRQRKERGGSRRRISRSGTITIMPLEKPSLELRVEDETLSSSETVSEIQSVLETISWTPER